MTSQLSEGLAGFVCVFVGVCICIFIFVSNVVTVTVTQQGHCDSKLEDQKLLLYCGTLKILGFKVKR